MTAVFATKIFAFDPENISQRVLLTRERLQAIDQMNGEGRQQSFAASLLLEYVLKRLFPKVEHPLEIAVAQGGKPYLANYPDIYFNLSHSGEWAVCAISESPVGVDIQHCDEGRRDVASRFFHREEIRYLDGLPQFRRDEGFYRLWTLKESSSRRPDAVLTCRCARSGWTSAAAVRRSTAAISRDSTSCSSLIFRPTRNTVLRSASATSARANRG